jgi:DNA-damage-inducible protein J
MAQTNINIRMDEELKQEFDRLCTELGLNMTTAFNVFARAVVRTRRIPFEIALDAPNTETLEAIEEVKRMKKDPSLGKGYTDIDQMMKELLS